MMRSPPSKPWAGIRTRQPIGAMLSLRISTFFLKPAKKVRSSNKLVIYAAATGPLVECHSDTRGQADLTEQNNWQPNMRTICRIMVESILRDYPRPWLAQWATGIGVAVKAREIGRGDVQSDLV